jgi:hypothetical protein
MILNGRKRSVFFLRYRRIFFDAVFFNRALVTSHASSARDASPKAAASDLFAHSLYVFACVGRMCHINRLTFAQNVDFVAGRQI